MPDLALTFHQSLTPFKMGEGKFGVIPRLVQGIPIATRDAPNQSGHDAKM